MKVLHILAGLPEEGGRPIQPYIASQIASLIKAGIEVDILNLNEYGRGWKKYWKGIGVLRRQIRQTHYDLLHGHFSYCGWVARFQSRLPVVVSLMGRDLLGYQDNTWRGYFDRQITLSLVRMVDYVIVKSEDMARHVRGVNKLAVIPNGVDLEFFKPMDYTECRQALGINDHEFVVLFPANPGIPRKNCALARQAVEVLKTKYEIPIRFWVIFNRPQQELPQAMNAADVLLMTSIYEGSPNVVKEAMACNLPIVSVPVGDVPKIITGSQNCFIAGYDPESLGEKLFEVALTGRRSNGREHIQDLCLEKIAERILTIYGEILST